MLALKLIRRGGLSTALAASTIIRDGAVSFEELEVAVKGLFGEGGITKPSDHALSVQTETGHEVILFVSNGEIWVERPGREEIAFLLKIADEIAGRVRGDELETYRTPDETYVHPDDVLEKREQQNLGEKMVKRSRKRGLLIYANIIAVFLLVGYLASRLSH